MRKNAVTPIDFTVTAFRSLVLGYIGNIGNWEAPPWLKCVVNLGIFRLRSISCGYKVPCMRRNFPGLIRCLHLCACSLLCEFAYQNSYWHHFVLYLYLCVCVFLFVYWFSFVWVCVSECFCICVLVLFCLIVCVCQNTCWHQYLCNNIMYDMCLYLCESVCVFIRIPVDIGSKEPVSHYDPAGEDK